MKLELQIGTKLLFETRNSKSVHTITRETPTLWVTDKDEKIRKSDNSIYGRGASKYNSYSTTTFKLLTEEDLEELRIERIIYKLKDKISKFNFKELDYESLMRIDEIISKKQ